MGRQENIHQYNQIDQCLTLSLDGWGLDSEACLRKKFFEIRTLDECLLHFKVLREQLVFEHAIQNDEGVA